MNNEKTTINLERYQKFRILSLIGFICFPTIYLFLHSYNNSHPVAMLLLNAVLSMYFILNWYYLDTEINHFTKKTHTIAACIILFAAVTIPYYLYKSRPKQKRIRDILIAFAVFITHVVIASFCLSVHLK